MIVTARQLEELHRTNGHVTLPYRARLTPLAQDWLRSKRIKVGYTDTEPAPQPEPQPKPHAPSRSDSSTILWWCDGPCGPAKAAITGLERDNDMQPLPMPSESRQTSAAVKKLAEEIRNERAAMGVLLVKSGAAALVYANRCPSLRAVLGTCLDAVEQGLQQVAANVLVIEYPHQTLQQMRNMLSRFVRGRQELSEEVKRQLQEMASCE